MVRLTCYGGVSQIGGNQFLLEDGDARLLFDCGTPYGQRNRFYEEYLKPRGGFGLLDLTNEIFTISDQKFVDGYRMWHRDVRATRV